MKPIPRLLSRASLYRRTSLVLSAVMVGGLAQFAATPEATAQGNTRPNLPNVDKPVAGKSGQKVKPRTLTKGPKTPQTDPKAAWPEAGAAVVDIPGEASKTAPKPVQAKGLPISLAPVNQAQDSAPGAVEARVLDREVAERAGVQGVLFSLTAKDETQQVPKSTAKSAGRGKTGSKVVVTVDYSTFADAFGGSYASRLQLVEMPACALTTVAKGSCLKSTPLKTTNNTAKQTLTAKAVSLSSNQPTVLAATAAAEGEKGDYKATDLAASAAWDTNLNTGDFNWSYGMPVPEVPGGLKPSVGLSYASGALDGRTGGTNNQGSTVGDGFNLWPGYIERKYKPCADDGVKNADGIKPGDLCWAYDNAFLSFSGMGGELVPAGTDTWKLKNDDGTKIARLRNTDLANGDNDGEYWRMTTPDGTRYYFGYNRPDGWAAGKDETNSSWTVPVFGNNSGEECNKATFAQSWCQQTWRWNLDAVIDPHGNLISYYYGKEDNSYGRNLKATDDTSYTRGGYLKRIEYGLRNFYDKPQAQVVFDNSERCLPEAGVTCTANTIDDKKFYWYDTPWDLNCKAGTDCDNGRLSPTFWTRKRLTEVTTQVLKADGTYGKVDSWKLAHRWGMADVDYQLLLDSVQHTGHTASTPITLPKTTFAYTKLENRLDETGDGYAPFIKSRLSTVADESGGQIDANYSSPVCKEGNLPAPHTNTTRCFPQYIGGSSDSDPELHWFNKYVVNSLTETDRTGGSPDQVTQYEYLGDAAWHFDDSDGLTKEKNKTWSQWRGYGHVRVKTGGQSGAMKSQSDSYFLRGMHGDRKDKTGGTKTVSVTLGTGEGESITDHESAAGMEYKSVTFDAVGGKVLAKTVSRPWHHETAEKVRDWGTLTANFTGTAESKTWTSLDNGAGTKWRTTANSATYDTVAGRVIRVHDQGDTSITTDDQCTRTTYTTSAKILGLPSRVETVAKPCDATVDRSKDVTSDVRTAYDGGTYGADPTKGDATAVATLKSHDGTRATYLEAGATFDGYGRTLTTTDLTATVTANGTAAPVRTARNDGRTSKNSYSPATGLPTKTTSTTPPAKAGDGSTAQTTTTTFDPLRGQPLTQTDTNSNTTELAYDALGRSTKVWLADRRNSQTPNREFVYRVEDGEPVAVTTKTLDNSGGQISSHTLYDGFLRERQSQTPGPDGGRILTDSFYDERGLVTKSFAPYYATGAPSLKLFKPVDAEAVETQTRTTYDALGRATETRHIAGNGDGGTVLSTTKTIYGGDRTTVIPPQGGTATTTLTDARGQTTELRQHHSRSIDAAFDTTTYGYTPHGQLAKVTDPVGNSWTYTYDQLGRQTKSDDPDKGVTKTVYDDRSQVTSTEDARGTRLFNIYDNLGRKIELREESTAGTLRSSWVYDTLTGAKGQLAESTRYQDGNAYTSKITQYDKQYRPIRTAVVIPDSEGALAGTYQSGASYKPSGLLGGVSYSAAGALPGGAVVYSFEDRTLRPIRVSGQGMTASVKYSNTGKPLQYELGLTSGGKKTWSTNTYQWGTQRLATSRVDREDQNGVDRHATYTYDELGNVLSISDVSRTGTDNQCFTYDYKRQVKEAWAQAVPNCAAAPSAPATGGPAPYWNSYTYDKIGNRATETRHDPGGNVAKDIQRTYTYPAPGGKQPHTLTSVTDKSTSGTKTDNYSYDTTGNTTVRPNQVLGWDAEGHLAKVTEGSKTTEYLYDTQGSRLIGRTATETTLYLGHTEVTLPRGAATTKATRYIDIAGGHQAIRTDDGTFDFTLADHHGTGQLAINSENLAIQQRRTDLFGNPRGTAPAAWPGTKGFVGGTDDTKTTGLTHLGAREYDAELGRFVSVDPILDLADPQQMHGYVYANNNPSTLSDPTGLRPDGPVGGNSYNDERYNQERGKQGSTWFKDNYGGWSYKHVQFIPAPMSSSSNRNGSLVTYSWSRSARAHGHTKSTGASWTSWDADRGNGGLVKLAQNALEAAMSGPLAAAVQGDFDEAWERLNACTPNPNAAGGCEPKIGTADIGPGGLGRGLAKGAVPKPGPRVLPHGFGNPSQFREFTDSLKAGLERAGHGDAVPVFQGSAVTGRSFSSGKPFGPHSDFDVALTGPQILARAKAAGVSLRSGGTRTGPLKGADLHKLGLNDVAASLSADAGRPVNFMIYGATDAATSRA
ncbi:RHS repeat-associated core domain-containing protein, partial [Streptomyces sp. YPW6]|uniref:RHS repeat-associated core domain-containing protein n=1 Tax=Streptomyces sp. YPW6 TaxID=2840373 RepID=UPI003EB7B105